MKAVWINAAALMALSIAPTSAGTYVDSADDICEVGTPICHPPDPTPAQREEQYKHAQWILNHLSPEQRRLNAIGEAIQEQHNAIDRLNSHLGVARHAED